MLETLRAESIGSGFLEYLCVQSWHREKERWPDALNNPQHCSCLRLARKQHGGCTGMKGKHQSIAESVRVEEFGRRKGDVIGTNSYHFVPVVPAAADPVVMQVD
jgi:hypothetical protein